MKDSMKRRSDRLCAVITFIGGVVTALLYLIYLILSLYYGFNLLSLIISALAIGLSLSAVIFRNRLPRILRWIFCVGLCLYVITFAAFCVMIHVERSAMPANTEEPSVVLVFGCRTYGMTPGRQLTSRLETAIQLLNVSQDTVCVVSGGQGPNETVSEAEAMKAYLISHGISANRIYTEGQSSSTIENIRYSKEVIKENNLSDRPLIAVSSIYHLPRIRMLGEWYDLPISGFAGAESSNSFVLIGDLVREYMAYVKLIFVH